MAMTDGRPGSQPPNRFLTPSLGLRQLTEVNIASCNPLSKLLGQKNKTKQKTKTTDGENRRLKNVNGKSQKPRAAVTG